MNARIHTERLANPDGDLVHFLDAVLRQETTTSIAEDSPLLFDAGEDVVRRVVRDAEGHVVSHAAARIAVYRSGMHAQSIAIIGAVVAEFAAGSGGVRGLAWQILDAGNKLQTDRMIAALVVLAVMGVAVHAGLERLERAGLRWWRGR